MCRRGESSHREEGEHPSRDHAYCRQRECGCDYRRRAQLYAGSVDGDEDTYDHCRDGQVRIIPLRHTAVLKHTTPSTIRSLGMTVLFVGIFLFLTRIMRPLSPPRKKPRVAGGAATDGCVPSCFVAFFHYIPKEWRAYFFPVPFASGLVYLALHYLADTDAAWLAFLAIPLYYIPAALYTLSVIRSRKRGAANNTPKNDV